MPILKIVVCSLCTFFSFCSISNAAQPVATQYLISRTFSGIDTNTGNCRAAPQSKDEFARQSSKINQIYWLNETRINVVLEEPTRELTSEIFEFEFSSYEMAQAFANGLLKKNTSSVLIVNPKKSQTIGHRIYKVFDSSVLIWNENTLQPIKINGLKSANGDKK